MFGPATNPAPSRRSGGALVALLIAGVVLFGIAYATTLLSSVEVRDARSDLDELRTRGLAEAGVERAMHLLAGATEKNPFDPIGSLRSLFGGQPTLTAFEGETLEVDGAAVGAFTVRLTLEESSADEATVRIESSGYLPRAPVDLAPGERVRALHAQAVTVRYALAPSEVFNYAYFINNWGWLYGDDIYITGNAGANGRFDTGGYSPTITGQPIYDQVQYDGTGADLTGYHDDNGDGLEDGKDGGLFVGWNLIGGDTVQGGAGAASNQHAFQDTVEMPNLNDFTLYETLAFEQSSSLSIGGDKVFDGVYGDEEGEKGNLYLVGTLENPIELDGPVVVRGDVVISGMVTGQGAIYAAGNVYVPDSVEYLDGPTTATPDGTTEDTTEAWLTENGEKDLLGLFARENIVVGDYTDPTWESKVSGWMASDLNSSAEDAGEDGIPNTEAGKDGILGTEDDDVLEGDGVFTVERYTELDQALGLIPAGKSVGDPIPGTGEDIDGDGEFDGTTTMADLQLSTPLSPTYWGGNLPLAGIADYSDVATVTANRLDAVFYTNHAFCYYVTGDQDADIRGALISRNENVVYGTPAMHVTYDARLLGGASGKAGAFLPRVIQDPVILRWEHLVADPNQAVAVP